MEINGSNPIRVFYENGQQWKEFWYLGSKFHRLDGPAYSEWYTNGKIANQNWFRKGNLHRIGGPAKLGHSRTGEIISEHWFVRDKLHRLDGPAVSFLKDDGIWSHSYYVKGEEAPFLEEWLAGYNLIGRSYDEWTDEEKVLFRMSF